MQTDIKSSKSKSKQVQKDLTTATQNMSVCSCLNFVCDIVFPIEDIFFNTALK